MVGLPRRLIAGLLPADVSAAVAWWSGLSETARCEVVALWDEREDHCFFGPAPDRDGAVPPVVIGGRFVPRDDDDAAGWAEWYTEYVEYLLNHEELVYEPPVFRVFYIGCTRHEAARAVLAAGRIPADFRCPLERADCPLRRMIDGSHGRPWLPWPRLAEAFAKRREMSGKAPSNETGFRARKSRRRRSPRRPAVRFFTPSSNRRGPGRRPRSSARGGPARPRWAAGCTARVSGRWSPGCC